MPPASKAQHQPSLLVSNAETPDLHSPTRTLPWEIRKNSQLPDRPPPTQCIHEQGDRFPQSLHLKCRETRANVRLPPTWPRLQRKARPPGVVSNRASRSAEQFAMHWQPRDRRASSWQWPLRSALLREDPPSSPKDRSRRSGVERS